MYVQNLDYDIGYKKGIINIYIYKFPSLIVVVELHSHVCQFLVIAVHFFFLVMIVLYQ